VKLLMDTHYVYAVAGAPVRLSAQERAYLSGHRSLLLASVLSLWEIRLKWNARHSSGDRKGPASPDAVRAVLLEIGIPLIDFRPEHACGHLDPPLSHTDPFDEMLLIQAGAEGARLLTRDRRLAGHRLVQAV
jgi:PIN domain nuclease of toxin-antitoxin system